MSKIVKGNIVYEDGKPVYYDGQIQNLKKCPNCKETEIEIRNRVEKVKTLRDGKVTNTWIAENEHSFSCYNCEMVIEINGRIEFENGYDEQ